MDKEIVSNCCTATFVYPGWSDSDICSECHEHADIMEKAHEFDDGAFENWMAENLTELSKSFIEDNWDDWENFCKEQWNEANE